MNQEIKRKWVAALRSGEYQQGKGRLRSHKNEFCCLGVLCDLHRKAHNGNWCEVPTIDEAEYCGYAGSLPPIVALWAGLSASDPIVCNNHLSEHNDGIGTVGKTFLTIADLIEQHL